MNSTHARHSFIGGLIGGTLGYLLCGLTGNMYAQILGFFVFGYLGYDLRQLIETTRTQVPVMWHDTRMRVGRKLDETWATDPELVILSPLVPLSWFVFFAKMMDMSNRNGHLLNGFSFWITLHQFIEKFQWLATGIENEAMLADHNPLRRLLVFILLFLVAGACSTTVWGCTVLMVKMLHEAFGARAKIGSALMTLPLHFAWICFWLVPGLLIGVAKLAAKVVSLVHSAGRVTTGIATAIGGMTYVYFVPFHMGIPLPATAILCGLCAGACARALNTFLDHTKLDERLSTFLATPISAWSPLPVPAWVQLEQRVHELNKNN